MWVVTITCCGWDETLIAGIYTSFDLAIQALDMFGSGIDWADMPTVWPHKPKIPSLYTIHVEILTVNLNELTASGRTWAGKRSCKESD